MFRLRDPAEVTGPHGGGAGGLGMLGCTREGQVLDKKSIRSPRIGRGGKDVAKRKRSEREENLHGIPAF